MRMAVTSSWPAYDPKVIEKRLGTVIELSDIIRNRQESECTGPS
jgi:hypothetical protein